MTYMQIEQQENNIRHSDGLPEKQMLIWAGRANNYKNSN